MAEVLRNKKPLTVRPLKTSPATGAALATLGFTNAIPLMHGSQGCGAFAKVFLIQHFREPMPIQNTAIDQIAAVMGSDSNIQDALNLLTHKHQPDLITLISTGLTEMQGSDIDGNARLFSQNQTEQFTHVAPVHCPDFTGTLQSGFASALHSVITQVLSQPVPTARHESQINILCGSALTSADIELISRYTEAFQLDAIIAPDISSSLDGYLQADIFSPTSTGGTALTDIKRMPQSRATLCIGESVYKTGQWLKDTFRIPCIELPHIHGMTGADELVLQLKKISNLPVPNWIKRARQRLQDTLLDTHFVLSGEKIALAQESDALTGLTAICSDAGIQMPLAITTANSASLTKLACEKIVIGDLNDLLGVIDDISMVIGNTHCAEFLEPAVPVLRFGFPCHDRFGNSDVCVIGYEGARATLHQLANLRMSTTKPELEPYISPYQFSASELNR